MSDEKAQSLGVLPDWLTDSNSVFASKLPANGKSNGKAVTMPLLGIPSPEPPLPECTADTPVNFQDWRALLASPGAGRSAVILRMIHTLFPGMYGKDDLPASRINRLGSQLSWGRLAEFVWIASARPPTGNILDYVQRMAATAPGKPANPKAASRPKRQKISINRL